MALKKARTVAADSGAVLIIREAQRDYYSIGIAHAMHRITANTSWAAPASSPLAGAHKRGARYSSHRARPFVSQGLFHSPWIGIYSTVPWRLIKRRARSVGLSGSARR